MSNGKPGPDLWKTILAVLGTLGFTVASWVTLNSQVAAQGRDVVNVIERVVWEGARVTKVEERLSVAEREAAESRGDIKEIKAIVKRIEDGQRGHGRTTQNLSGIAQEPGPRADGYILQPSALSPYAGL